MGGDDLTVTGAELTAAASLALIEALDAELAAMYPEPGANHFQLDPDQVLGTRGAFLIVRRGARPAGCGALRMIDDDTGELKRMYVVPSERGRGLGLELVDALEAEARSRGARRLVLETGVRQHAALALYERCGFRRIPLYGEYLASPDTSICMGKDLA